MTQYGDDKTLGTLFPKIYRMKIKNGEKVKDFNLRFIILLNEIPSNIVDVVQIKFYIVTLPPPISIFVKRENKQTLDENL